MISLALYLEALYHPSAIYVLLVKHQVEAIENDSDWVNFQSTYLLENFKTTIHPNSTIILPELIEGEKRLWLISLWEQYNGEEAKRLRKEWIIKQMLKAELLK